ncbi:FAD-dependent oxidoreductase, partial [Streptomyces sp. NPDC096153]
MGGEVIVVGGGVIGLTTAVELAERGRRVRMWTREP